MFTFQKRATIYDGAVKNFLTYFDRIGKLITVDVASGEPDIIWHRVHLMFCELGFEPRRAVNVVILFIFGECLYCV